MGNRKQPFGYKMSLGEIVIQESEAKLVQEIFLRYIAGESLNELTESLRQQDIPYDEGRLWNKNMVARILADTRYTGEKGYPKLIGEEQLIAANEKRSNKPQLPKKTEAQKVLRRLCGTPLSERVEQSVTDLLNSLANCPDRIRHQRSPAPATHPPGHPIPSIKHPFILPALASANIFLHSASPSACSILTSTPG